MTAQETIRRMADANPVPDLGQLHPDPVDAERLFSSIERRRDEMIGTQTRPSPSPASAPHPRPFYRHPAVVFLMALVTVMVVAVPLMIFGGDGSDVAETPAPTTPTPGVTTTVPATTLPETTIATTIPDDAPPTGAPFALDGWQIITPIPETAGAFERVVATEYGFVAISSTTGSGIWTSPDGVEWTRVGDPSDPVDLGVAFGISDLAANGDRVAAVVANSRGGSSGIASSTDGENWTYTILSDRADDPPWPLSIVAYGADGFIVTGSDSVSGDVVWSTTDGEEYQLVYEGRGLEGGGSFRTSASAGQRVVLGTEFGELLVTQDGETWELIPQLVGVDGAGQACSYVSLDALAYGPAGFVAAGGCGPFVTAWTSPDGSIWSQVPLDDTAFGEAAWLSSIAASDRGYVAGGNSGPGGEVRSPTVWTSPDGVDWTRVVLEATVVEDTGVLSVALHGNALVAVGWIDDEAAIWRAVLAD